MEALADNVASSVAKKIVIMSSPWGSITNNDGGDYIYRSSKAALNLQRGLLRILAIVEFRLWR